MTFASTEPIRVTHCIGSMRRGGTECQLASLIAALPPDRFVQSLVLFQGGGDLMETLPPECEIVDLRYSMSYGKFDPRFYGAMARALFFYVRHLRRFRPDVVHGWLYWANILSVFAARLSGPLAIVFAEPRAGVPAIITSRRQLGLFKDGRPVLQRIENFCNRFTRVIIANSNAVREDVIRREELKAERVRVIHNGVDAVAVGSGAREALRETWGVGDSGTVGVVLANFHAYKGHADALAVLERLHPEFPDFVIVFAGRDQGAESALREGARERGLESRVKFIGERTDVGDVLAAADFLIHPSRQEGFPNAILEAMAAGLPVVAYDLGACREAVIDQECGIIVPVQDIEALARAVRVLITDPARRRAMGEAGAERSRREFSMDQMIRQMASLYEEMSLKPTPKAP